MQHIKRILAKQHKATEFLKGSTLREIRFRSLEFSERMLRVEMETGNEMPFDAIPIGKIKDVSHQEL